ncbi:hypothetical protein ABIB54_003372 [Frigoribacterium sp. UYMn621]
MVSMHFRPEEHADEQALRTVGRADRRSVGREMSGRGEGRWEGAPAPGCSVWPTRQRRRVRVAEGGWVLCQTLPLSRWWRRAVTFRAAEMVFEEWSTSWVSEEVYVVGGGCASARPFYLSKDSGHSPPLGSFFDPLVQVTATAALPLRARSSRRFASGGARVRRPPRIVRIVPIVPIVQIVQIVQIVRASRESSATTKQVTGPAAKHDEERVQLLGNSEDLGCELKRHVSTRRRGHEIGP